MNSLYFGFPVDMVKPFCDELTPDTTLVDIDERDKRQMASVIRYINSAKGNSSFCCRVDYPAESNIGAILRMHFAEYEFEIMSEEEWEEHRGRQQQKKSPKTIFYSRQIAWMMFISDVKGAWVYFWQGIRGK